MILEELPKQLHDLVIREIRHSVETTEVAMLLSNLKKLVFYGVVLFRSESYFVKPTTISSDALYISGCEVKHQSWLIEEALNQFKPDGEKKWGDQDLENWGFRKGEFIHINLYCNDWEFDIVCKNITLE